MSTTRAQELIGAAIERVAAFDAIDKRHGMATPADVGVTEIIRTAEAALVAALNTEDWTCVADAVVMLRQAMPRRQKAG